VAKFENQTFEGGTVSLDGNEFVRCTFRDVVLKYAGQGVDMTDCNIEQFRFQFDGDLARGLHTLYQLFGTEGLLTLIRGFTDPQPAKPGDAPIRLG
jgi:hypothetical protein